MNSESTLENTLRLAVKRSGGLCFKLPAFLYRGIPDRLVLLPGARVWFVELKTDTGRTSVHQKRYQKILQTLGFNSVIIQGELPLKEFIHDHLSGAS